MNIVRYAKDHTYDKKFFREPMEVIMVSESVCTCTLSKVLTILNNSYRSSLPISFRLWEA